VYAQRGNFAFRQAGGSNRAALETKRYYTKIVEHLLFLKRKLYKAYINTVIFLKRRGDTLVEYVSTRLLVLTY